MLASGGGGNHNGSLTHRYNPGEFSSHDRELSSGENSSYDRRNSASGSGLEASFGEVVASSQAGRIGSWAEFNRERMVSSSEAGGAEEEGGVQLLAVAELERRCVAQEEMLHDSMLLVAFLSWWCKWSFAVLS